ncbi:starch synthase [Orenia metallireducens]|uniref:Glycogen synthase n=1 Tax=Orenia metallireducens TaxID=1413210 RepID=A0A285IEU5_9FIRM|nr:glycogen synthase GlgA [Orenia metallireducens]PRX18826.1 starch synthase [Orenia metallireducens]SNY46472.1 starch synthase [Orenia metallireducens]
MKNKLKILFVSSEVAPFAKTGGLADVAGSLPQAIKKEGHDIRVVMPQYSQIPQKYLQNLEHQLHFRTRVGWRDNYVGVNTLQREGVITYFIDNKNYFNRASLYDNEDKHIQFAYFCRAVLEMLPKINFQPDIIHCNDWQTGPLSIMLKENYQIYDFYKDIRTVYTIHNLRYQGVFGKEVLDDALALSSKYWDWGVVCHDDCINYMKMAIEMSDIITTVSKTYAAEIQTPYFGEGLDYVLRMNSDDLYGIVNGISHQENDPTSDDRIYAKYSVDNLSGKYENKRRLQADMGLPIREDVPVISLISRLVEQKGLDLIAAVIDELLQENIQLIILGTGEYVYEEMFKEVGWRYPNKVSANIRYDSNLAQKIYAGSDIFLMPSKYEPCGLGQLFSLRYGTIPVVRETGGLNDTISSYNEVTEEGNGFTFRNYNAHDMLYTLRRAISFYHQPELWNELVKKAMESDFSWNNSACEYIQLYCKLLGIDQEEVNKNKELETKVLKLNMDLNSQVDDLAQKVNLNLASKDILTNLKGVGPSLAERIVNYRIKEGTFENLDELKKVKGIGSKLFGQLKGLLTY